MLLDTGALVLLGGCGAWWCSAVLRSIAQEPKLEFETCDTQWGDSAWDAGLVLLLLILGSFANAAIHAKRYGLAVSHWTPGAKTREEARKDAHKETQPERQDAVPQGPQAHQAFNSFSVAGESAGGSSMGRSIVCSLQASKCASAPASPNSGTSRCSGAAVSGSSAASSNENEAARQVARELSEVLWFTHVNCGAGADAGDSDAASETVSHGPLGCASNADSESVSSSSSDVVM